MGRWFAIDFVSAFPFDRCVEAARPSSHLTGQLLNFVSMLKLLRLLRLQKLMRYLSRWSDDLGLLTANTSVATQMVWLVFSVLTFIHVNACLQFIVPRANNFPADCWPRKLSTEMDVHSCAVLIDNVGSDDAISTARWGCYSQAFFQALSQMLCIGFGLVYPTRTDEVWVTVASMLVGASAYAVSLAFAVNVVSSVDQPSRLYKNTLEVLNEFMRVRTLPTELRERLRSYFNLMYPNRRFFNERSVIAEFSYSLRSDIRMAMCATLFANTPIFESAPPALLSVIAPRLMNEIAMPGDYLAREGEMLNYVAFIEHGKVDVRCNDQHVAEMGDGSYMGEISALGLGVKDGNGVALATATVRESLPNGSPVPP